MDMKETSAMTEASGLVDQGGIERSSARPSADAGTTRRSSQSPASDAAMRLADQLREVTVKAPLRSVAMAFLIGVWVARRRRGPAAGKTARTSSHFKRPRVYDSDRSIVVVS
jgi:hypothetical protein